MSLGPEEYPESYPAPETPNTGRVLLPGIFLVIVAVLNLALAAGAAYVGFGFSQLPHAEVQKVYDDAYAKLDKDQREGLKQMGIENAEDLRNVYVRWGIGLGVVWGLAALPALLGGILMCARRARGLAIFGAIVAVLPLVSPSACPCIVGMAIGIWALVALFSADGKAAFR